MSFFGGFMAGSAAIHTARLNRLVKNQEGEIARQRAQEVEANRQYWFNQGWYAAYGLRHVRAPYEDYAAFSLGWNTAQQTIRANAQLKAG